MIENLPSTDNVVLLWPAGLLRDIGEGGPKLDTVSSWTPLLKVDRIKTKIFKQAYLM